MSSSNKAIYVRIRRKQQTFYVFLPSDVPSADYLKDEIIMALSGLRHESRDITNSMGLPHRMQQDNDDDDDDDDNDDDGENNANSNTLTRQDLKIMDTAGTELLDRDQLTKLVNEQELHVVFRISDDEYEPVQVQYADMAE